MFQFAMCGAIEELVEGAAKPSMAEMLKKTQPSRLVAGFHHPGRLRVGSQPRRGEAW